MCGMEGCRSTLKSPRGERALTEAAASDTRDSHSPLASRQATCTCQRDGFNRRSNSIICRSVPPTWQLDITNAIGNGPEPCNFIDGYVSNRGARHPVQFAPSRPLRGELRRTEALRHVWSEWKESSA